MTNLHKIHRIVQIAPVGSTLGFITPVFDTDISRDTQISTIAPQGTDAVVDTQGSGTLFTIKMSLALNPMTMKLMDEIAGNPDPNVTYSSSEGEFTETSGLKKNTNFKNNRAFTYQNKVDITVTDSVEPIDFSSPKNIFSIINGNISRVEKFYNCTVKHLGNSSGTDFTKVMVEVVTGENKAVSKVLV